MKLSNRDPEQGLSITVNEETAKDVTNIFTEMIGQKSKSIKFVLSNCDFDFIYNGILQHSDHAHTDRFLAEYNSGELNYAFFKHSAILSYIKDCLYLHYRVVNAVTFPKFGSL